MLSRQAALESGKQAVKTSIAGLISLYITDLFHLPEGYWAAISALIVMQSNVGATLSASRTRLAGTAVGALIGGLFVAFWGMNKPGVNVNMIAFALAVTIAFVVCDLLHLPDSQRLATVTVAIIMLAGRTSSAWVIALHRFSEVALGIMIALVVSLTLWPNHARRSVRQGLAGALMKSRVFYEAVMDRYRGNSAASIDPLRTQVQDALRKNADLLKNALQEAFGPMKERESVSLLTDQVERIFAVLETLEFAVNDGPADTYFRNFDASLARLEAGISQGIESLSKTVAAGGAVSPEWPDLSGIAASLDAQAAQARKAGRIQNYPLDDVLRFYFLLLSSRNLIRELEIARTITLRFPSRESSRGQNS